MSKIAIRDMNYASCGATMEQRVVMSVYVRDKCLDGRPLYAPTVLYECQKCHYSASSIEFIDDETKAYVQSAEFQEKCKAYSGPEFLRKFDFAIDIASHTGNMYDAARYCLKGAWVCDDKDLKEKAKAYRMKYLEYVRYLTVIPKDEFFVYLDVCRRVGNFTHAEEFYNHLKSEFSRAKLKIPKCAEYEMYLCKQHDSDSHTFGEMKNSHWK